MLECEKTNKFTLKRENSKGEWEQITEIYRKNKKRSCSNLDPGLEQDN